MHGRSDFWRRMFFAAAIFNYCFGIPIMLASRWSYALAFRPPLPSGKTLTTRFWSDFGFAVVLIGAGYQLVSRDVRQNRGIVWLGIFAKLFDVVTLSYRFITGVAKPIVLVPAVIDGGFTLLFAGFLHQSRGQSPRAR